jgi:hypothetical protein
MPKISALLAERRTIEIDIAGEPLAVTLSPRGYTPRVEAKLKAAEGSPWLSDGVVDLLSSILVDWDMTDDDGKPFPPTRENLEALPTVLLLAVMAGIKAGSRPNPPSGETSAAS